jgi:hypothetical protein
MSRWFRHYAGMMRDDKLVRVALRSGQPVERVLWVWGAILESAAEIDDAGRYDFDGDEAAYFLRADAADMDAILVALGAAGRVAGNFVVKWGDRQYQSDRSASRQADYRARKKAELQPSDPEKPNGDVTVPSLSRRGDAPELDTELELELETETEKTGKTEGARKRATRLPVDYEPDISVALSLGLSRQQAETEAPKFRDHFTAAPGQRGVKNDWPATWRNWCRRTIETEPKHGRNNQLPGNKRPHDALFSALAVQASQGSGHDQRPSGADVGHGTNGFGTPADSGPVVELEAEAFRRAG